MDHPRDDSSRLFALLADQEIPVARLDQLSETVRDAIDQQVSDREVLAFRRRRGLGWSVAASLFLAAALTGVILMPQSGTDSAAVAPQATRVGATAFELLSSPSQVQVVDLSVGDIQIVMIFDEAINL